MIKSKKSVWESLILQKSYLKKAKRYSNFQTLWVRYRKGGYSIKKLTCKWYSGMKSRENSAVLAAVHEAPQLASNLTSVKIVPCLVWRNPLFKIIVVMQEKHIIFFKIHALMIFFRKIIAKEQKFSFHIFLISLYLFNIQQCTWKGS